MDDSFWVEVFDDSDWQARKIDNDISAAKVEKIEVERLSAELKTLKDQIAEQEKELASQAFDSQSIRNFVQTVDAIEREVVQEQSIVQENASELIECRSTFGKHRSQLKETGEKVSRIKSALKSTMSAMVDLSDAVIYARQEYNKLAELSNPVRNAFDMKSLEDVINRLIEKQNTAAEQVTMRDDLIRQIEERGLALDAARIRFEELKSQRDVCSVDVQKKREELKRVRNEIERLNTLKAEKTTLKEELSTTHQSCMEEVALLKEQQAENASKISAVENSVAHKKLLLQQLKTDNERLLAEHRSTSQELESSAAEKEALFKSEEAELSAAVTAAKQECAKLSDEISVYAAIGEARAKHQERVAAMNIRMDELNREIGQVNEHLQHRNNAISSHAKDNEALAAEEAELDDNLRTTKEEIKKELKEVTTVEKRHKELARKVKQATDDLNSVKKAKNDAQEAFEKLQVMIAQKRAQEAQKAALSRSVAHPVDENSNSRVPRPPTTFSVAQSTKLDEPRSLPPFLNQHSYRAMTFCTQPKSNTTLMHTNTISQSSNHSLFNINPARLPTAPKVTVNTVKNFTTKQDPIDFNDSLMTDVDDEQDACMITSTKRPVPQIQYNQLDDSLLMDDDVEEIDNRQPTTGYSKPAPNILEDSLMDDEEATIQQPVAVEEDGNDSLQGSEGSCDEDIDDFFGLKSGDKPSSNAYAQVAPVRRNSRGQPRVAANKATEENRKLLRHTFDGTFHDEYSFAFDQFQPGMTSTPIVRRENTRSTNRPTSPVKKTGTSNSKRSARYRRSK